MPSHVGHHPAPAHRRTPSRLRRRLTVWGTALALPLALTAGAATTRSADAAPPPTPRGVIANLWEWNWTSISQECTDVLGPGGYGGVQVAPPQNSVKRVALGNGSDTVLHPWWEVYQPVDYTLNDSRMGTQAEFRAMVRTCRAAGVKVYVDAVINHMADPAQGGQSYGGATYAEGDYTDYDAQDFHVLQGECPSASGDIEDFNNLAQVFRCDLVGLPDLRTETGHVRAEVAGYLNKLLTWGVSGFRVDAAKHVGQADLDAIYARLRNTVDGTRPAWALEVFGGAPGVLSPQSFVGSGTLLGLDGGQMIKNAFKSYPDGHIGSIATLRTFGPEAGLTPSNRTWTFVANHDTERGDALSYKDGARNILAHAFVLAFGYGTPQVYSAFEFTANDASPPADAEGLITDTVCGDQWTCVDRDPTVLGMVGFYNRVGDAPRANWWDDGENVIAFSRGGRGWVALNNGTEPATITVRTGLARGTYCDLATGPRVDGECSSDSRITVGSGGRATVTVPAGSAVATTYADRA